MIRSDSSGTTSVLRVPARDRRRRAAIAVLLLVGFLLLGVGVAALVRSQPLVAAAFSGACLLLWLAAAVFQHIGHAQVDDEV